MSPNASNQLLAVVGILLSVVMATASMLVAGVVIGLVGGVLVAPVVGRGSAWLARYLRQ
jgi:hypothetical protein